MEWEAVGLKGRGLPGVFGGAVMGLSGAGLFFDNARGRAKPIGLVRCY